MILMWCILESQWMRDQGEGKGNGAQRSRDRHKPLHLISRTMRVSTAHHGSCTHGCPQLALYVLNVHSGHLHFSGWNAAGNKQRSANGNAFPTILHILLDCSCHLFRHKDRRCRSAQRDVKKHLSIHFYTYLSLQVQGELAPISSYNWTLNRTVEQYRNSQDWRTYAEITLVSFY